MSRELLGSDLLSPKLAELETRPFLFAVSSYMNPEAKNTKKTKQNKEEKSEVGGLKNMQKEYSRNIRIFLKTDDNQYLKKSGIT